MESRENNLIGFLQKKSLFQNSPTKRLRKRSNSKSQESKGSIVRALQTQMSPVLNHHSSQLLPQQLSNRFQQNHKVWFQRQNYGRTQQTAYNSPHAHVLPVDLFRRNTETSFSYQSKNTPVNINDLMRGVATYAVNFQSARIESAQCLQTLSLKLSTQISNINYRLDQLRSTMTKKIDQELKTLNKAILQLVEQAFRDSQRTMQEYMRMQQARMAGDVLKIRQQLQREYIHVQSLKQQINRSTWRKVAGQILSTDLQNRIEKLLRHSGNTQISRWEMRDLAGQTLKSFQSELKALLRFNT